MDFKTKEIFLKRNIKSYLAFSVSVLQKSPFKHKALADLIGSVTNCRGTGVRIPRNTSKQHQSSIITYTRFIWASSGFRNNKFLALNHHTYTCPYLLLPIVHHLKWMTRRASVRLQWISGSWMAGRMFPSLIWSEQFS